MDGDGVLKRITKCKIGPYPRPMPEGMFGPMPKVHVDYDDGTEEDLFRFYPDELSFSESEFIGMTQAQARRLHLERDMAYIKT